MITTLKLLPRIAAPASARHGNVLQAADWPELEHKFYYAVDMGSGLRFFRVEIGKWASRWEGMLFIKEEHQSSSKITADEARQIAEAISSDPYGAMITYGQHVGRCGRCGRTLTTEESRSEGIGPICAKLGPRRF